MALTRVSRHIIDDPFNPTAVSATDVTTTNINASGIGTVGTLRVTGDLTVEGTTTTLDSILTEVDRLEVSANSTVAAGIITQTGSGDILQLYDGSNKEFSVDDGGTVRISQSMAFQQSDRATTAGLLGRGSLLIAGTQQTDFAIRSAPHNSNLILGVGVTERLRVDSAGRILLGTTTEGESGADDLTIATSSTTGITIRSGTSNAGNIYFSDGTSGAAEYRGYISYMHNEDSFAIGTDGNEKVRITSGGNIGIGTDNPETNFQVRKATESEIRATENVSGHYVSLYQQANDSYIIAGKSSGTPTQALRFYTGGSEKVRIGSDGKVGIGTDASGSQLNVGRASGNTALTLDCYGVNRSRLIFRNNVVRGTETNIDAIDDDLRFVTNSGESLRITSGGDVGIGDDAPDSSYGTNLSVHSTATNGARLKLSDGTTGKGNTDGLDIISTGSVAYFINRENADMSFSTNNTERLRITSAGLVRVPDNGKFVAGSGDDLQIFHGNNLSYVANYTGELILLNQTNDGDISIHSDNGSGGTTPYFRADGSTGNAILYHYGTEKLSTTTTGAKVTGALEVTQEYPSIRPTLDLNFAATKTLDRKITFTRDSLGTYTDENRLVKYASNNTPRFDHDPATGESLGLLIEESRTNLVPDSTTYAGWTTYSCSIPSTTQETLAPDGTYSAIKIISAGTQSQFGFREEITYSANTIYTHSMWLKAGTATRVGLSISSGSRWTIVPYLIVDLDTGTVNSTGSSISTKLTAYPNGWYLLEATGQFGGTSQVDGIWSYTATPSGHSGDTTSYYYQWGGQIEEASFATSYIPTSGSTAPRSADLVKITGTNFTDFYNQTEGTFSVTAKPNEPNNGSNYYFIFEAANSSDFSNAVSVGKDNGNTYRLRPMKYSDLSDTSVAYTTNLVNIAIAGSGSGDGVAVVNGTVSATSTGTPSGTQDHNVLHIGNRYPGTSGGHYNGTIKLLKYYNKRLPNAQLQGLTQQ